MEKKKENREKKRVNRVNREKDKKREKKKTKRKKMSRVNYYQYVLISQKEKLNILAEMLKISKSGRLQIYYNRPPSL